MYLIDVSYFIKNLHVPNTGEPTSDAYNELEVSIDRYVRQFLQLTLGSELFFELNSYVIDGELNSSAPQIWLNLVNGCNYTNNGINYTWKGLIYEEGLFKGSILAYFVYCNHFQNTANSVLGQVAIDPKNGVVINPTSHLVNIWNEFIEMYQGSCSSSTKTTFYDGVIFEDYFQNKTNGYVSYLQFLRDNKADYPNFEANVINFVNSFGI